MERERTDLAVGLVAVGAGALVVCIVLWLSPLFSRSSYPLFTEFDRVDGIDAQSRVYLHGFPVGQVASIEPRVADNGAMVFRVYLDLERRLPSGAELRLPRGTQAFLTPPQIPIGTGQIDLEVPSGGTEFLEAGARLAGVRRVAAMDQMQAMANGMGGDVSATVKSTRQLVDSMVVMMSHLNRTTQLASANLPALSAALQRELAAAEALTVNMNNQMTALGPRATAGLDSMSMLAADSRRLIVQLNQLAVEAQPRVNGILSNLDCTTGALETLTRQFAERPLGVVFRGVRAPQPCATPVVAGGQP